MELENFLKEQSLWANKLLVDNIYGRKIDRPHRIHDGHFTPRRVYTWGSSNRACDNIDENRYLLCLSEEGFRYYSDLEADTFIPLTKKAPFETIMKAMFMAANSFDEQPKGTLLIYNLDNGNLEWCCPEDYSMPADRLREKLEQMSSDTVYLNSEKKKGD